MACTSIDWSLHGDEIISLYVSGLSSREVKCEIERLHKVTYHNGTLTNFLGRNGVLRSKINARRLAISKAKRVCECCGKEHTPKNWNQRWCDVCSGAEQYSRRLTSHGLPAILIEQAFEKQGKCCAICGKGFSTMLSTSRKKTLFIDHNHETNQFRGLLCNRCNSALSFFDDKEWNAKALQYLEKAKQDPNPIFTRKARVRRYVRNKPTVISKIDATSTTSPRDIDVSPRIFAI